MVCDAGNLLVMSRDDHGRARVGEPPQVRRHELARSRVQTRGGLVEKKKRGLLRESLRQQDTLALSTGEFAKGPVP